MCVRAHNVRGWIFGNASLVDAISFDGLWIVASFLRACQSPSVCIGSPLDVRLQLLYKRQHAYMSL